MGAFRQEGLEITKCEVLAARSQIITAAENCQLIVAELNKDEPNIQLPVSGVLGALQSASDHLDTSGEVIVVVQEDIGVPEKDVSNLTPTQLMAWKVKYRATAKIFKALKHAIAKKLPIPMSTVKSPDPWSTTDITALITAITAAAGAAGLGAKKIKDLKTRADESRYLAGELKNRCNSDFTKIIGGAPATIRDHRKLKAKEKL
jgi:hypothetical protein